MAEITFGRRIDNAMFTASASFMPAMRISGDWDLRLQDPAQKKTVDPSPLKYIAASTFDVKPGHRVSTTYDEQGRLHSHSMQPAVCDEQGNAFYFLHGVKVPAKVVLAPLTITAAEIDDEENTEVRRVMLELFGFERFMQESGAKVVHKDETGELFQKKLRGEREPLMMVKVKNSTAEPDGTFKFYCLRVPPRTKTAREGIAWTFGLNEKQYQPELET